ncbi:hypothetical protein A3Q56_06044 [Intoshia linei]|uniref:UBA-like domain-containing protein n=1 Tax=Intoshia linei TaxID=1819745 RepID=A0A177AW41_9BILA|nr:hypothetical protein A3Q56_06044 [Intoshia linei]
MHDSNSQLHKDIKINQLIHVAGLKYDDAYALLKKAHWKYETALSMFFDENVVVKQPNDDKIDTNLLKNPSIQAPANTPVTPTNYNDAISMLSKMTTKPKRQDP